jgi:hypothetical protein
VPVIQHRVSVSILCPLVRPKKALGLESLIGSWLALEPTLSNACAASGAERVEHYRVMKPSSRNLQLGWSRYRGSQDQNPSRSEAGLDASDNIHVPTEGEGRFFFLTSPFIGQLNSRLDSGFVDHSFAGADGLLMCRSCLLLVSVKDCQIYAVLDKNVESNPRRLLRLKAIHSSRHVNHCLSLICAGAGRGSRTPKTRRSADFESAASASSAIPALCGSA